MRMEIPQRGLACMLHRRLKRAMNGTVGFLFVMDLPFRASERARGPASDGASLRYTVGGRVD
jgi:hypothetical protein